MPTVKVTLERIFMFLGAWIIFYVLDGHIWPDRILNIRTETISYSLGEAWGYVLVAYLIGSVMFSFVDHKIGKIEPINLRVGYVITGIFLMAISILTWNLIKAGG